VQVLSVRRERETNMEKKKMILFKKKHFQVGARGKGLNELVGEGKKAGLDWGRVAFSLWKKKKFAAALEGGQSTDIASICVERGGKKRKSIDGCGSPIAEPSISAAAESRNR